MISRSSSSTSLGKTPPVDTKGSSQKDSLKKQFLATEDEVDSGEAPTLQSTFNLRIDADEEITGHGNNYSDPTQAQFEGDGGLYRYSYSGDVSNFHFDDNPSVSDIEDLANSSGEEPGPTPAPIPAATPAPVQPAPQFSDDPAIAALQKSQHENTKNVVLYTELLQILNQALIDNPTLPKNSFDSVKGIFTESLHRCTARIEALSNETQVALDEHALKAQSLAAQAAGGSPPDDGQATFATTPKTVVTDAELDQLMAEVKQLPDNASRNTVISGLRTALTDDGAADHADLDRAFEQMTWDLEHPDMAGVDPELARFHLQWNEGDAEDAIASLGQDSEDMSSIVRDVDADDVDLDNLDFSPLNTHENQEKAATSLLPQKFFDELDELQDTNQASLASTAHGAKLPHAASHPPADLDAEQNALFADVEKMLDSADSKSSTNTVTSSKIPHAQGDLKKPVTVSQYDLIDIDTGQVREYSSEMTQLHEELQHAWNRELTSKEKAAHQKFVSRGGSPEEFLKNLLKQERIAIVKNFQTKHDKGIDDIQKAIIEIGSGKLMSDATPYGRRLHVAQLQAQKKTLKELIETGDRMISGF